MIQSFQKTRWKKNMTATAPPKKKTTASKTRSKQPKESSLDAELAPPIVTTVELLAAAKAAFDVSENMPHRFGVDIFLG